MRKNLVNWNIRCNFALAKRIIIHGSLAQLNRASDYGSEGYRFESCANHPASKHCSEAFFLFLTILFFLGGGRRKRDNSQQRQFAKGGWIVITCPSKKDQKQKPVELLIFCFIIFNLLLYNKYMCTLECLQKSLLFRFAMNSLLLCANRQVCEFLKSCPEIVSWMNH